MKDNPNHDSENQNLHSHDNQPPKHPDNINLNLTSQRQKLARRRLFSNLPSTKLLSDNNDDNASISHNDRVEATCFKPDIPTRLGFETRRLTKRVFDLRTGNCPPTSVETYNLPATSIHSTACGKTYHGTSVKNEDLPLTRTNHIGPVTEYPPPVSLAISYEGAASLCGLNNDLGNGIHTRAGLRSVLARLTTVTSQNYPSAGVLPPDSTSSLASKHDVTTLNDTASACEERVTQQQLPHSQPYNRADQQDVRTCIASAGIGITTRIAVFTNAHASTSNMNKAGEPSTSNYSVQTAPKRRASRALPTSSSRSHDSLPAYDDIGDCDQRFRHCGAAFWYEERLKGHSKSARPEYNSCCGGGKILMHPEPEPPDYIKTLLQDKHFIELQKIILPGQTRCMMLLGSEIKFFRMLQLTWLRT